jgi:hypothetical protein
MEQMKAQRLVRELAQLRRHREPDAIKLLRAYKAECAPFTDVMPEPLDFCDFGLVKEILDQPPDVNVDTESFLHLMPELDGIVEEWRCAILTKFIQEVKIDVVKRSIMLDDNPPDVDHASDESIPQRIQLACLVFACIPCEDVRGFDGLSTLSDFFTGSDFCNSPMKSRFLQIRPLWFPRALGHRCLTKPRGFDIADPAMRLTELPCHRQRWSCGSVIKVDQQACQAAVAIIEATGMDPRIATVDDMDQLDARLECLACLVPDVEDPSHIVFGWRSAVRAIFIDLSRNDPLTNLALCTDR